MPSAPKTHGNMLEKSQHLHFGRNQCANYPISCRTVHDAGWRHLQLRPCSPDPEAPLLRELASGRLHAVLDVFTQEPLPEDSELFQYPNLIMTPHNAGFPGRELFVPFLLQQFERYFQGLQPEGMIPPERFEAMTDESLAKKTAPTRAS